MPTLTLKDKIKLAQDFLKRDPKNLEAIGRGEAPYISYEGLTLLVADLCYKKKSDQRYNTNNTIVVWDEKKQAVNRPYQFTHLESLLDGINRLDEHEDLKIIAGMSFASLGHAVSIYCRRSGGLLKCFIYDSTRGLTFKSTSSHELIIALRALAKRLGLDYKIIINSTILEKDHHTCAVFSFLSLRYFMKHGVALFDSIDVAEKQFPYDGLFAEAPDERVVFLKADQLPEQLLKWGQYETLDEFIRYHQLKVQRIREVYGMPAEDICIKEKLQYDNPDLFALGKDNPKSSTIVSAKKQYTLAHYREASRGTVYDPQTGKVKKENALMATITKEQVLLIKIVDILNQEGAITQSLEIDEGKLSTLLVRAQKVLSVQSRAHSFSFFPEVKSKVLKIENQLGGLKP
ncbi:hypothetical protein ACNVED_13070 [Legionella sp. D16C41]|uniref:hypothetical protein n=1 Tax=Legionella sp. D16C41 TaxID=3402688 RepID=UPI003AF9416A